MMDRTEWKKLPFMLYADEKGRIYNHPRLRMLGLRGTEPTVPASPALIPMPAFSKLFYIPGCPPLGLDPGTGDLEVVTEAETNGRPGPCFAVAAFPEPGYVRDLLPAVDYTGKSYVLPSWAYTAVGLRDGQYWVSGFRIEYNRKWDPRHYDDRKLIPAIDRYRSRYGEGPLLRHLMHCATGHHCFAAKNLFLERWEAPLPLSRSCNAACLGCLSLQPDESCAASHERISFKPSQEEIVSLAVHHLERAPEAIVSFGQGCEGEPLTEHRLISESIREIRKRTNRGTINLNTNGSRPGRVAEIVDSGLDSIRISLNSAQPDLYQAYYRPRHYDFHDVVETVALCRRRGLYTMVNYLVFPGFSDRITELEALKALIRKTGINFLHLKNLCIDPQVYLEELPASSSPCIGMKQMAADLRRSFPDLTLGYFNQPVR
jgi:pyruvate-formate lyase-activating enzyme